MIKTISVREATVKLGTTLDAVYRLIYANKIAASKVGKRWMVSDQSVADRIAARSQR